MKPSVKRCGGRSHGHAATAEELAGRPVSYAEAEAALIAGFGEALALELVPGELTDAERTWAAELVRDGTSAEWTCDVRAADSNGRSRLLIARVAAMGFWARLGSKVASSE